MSGEVTVTHNGVVCKSDIMKKIDSSTEMSLIEQPVKKLPSVTISTASICKSSTSSSSSSTSSHISGTADSGIGSLIDDRSDLTEQLYIDPNLYVDIGNGDYCCPASPTTVPGRIVSSNSLESPARTTPSRPARRQRTTSVNSQSTTANPAECIIRANNRTIYTAGRPPWYNCAGQQVEPFVIGVCGGSASGKTTVAQKIIESLSVPWVTLLSMDCFYKAIIILVFLH
uniref:Uridine-cytidine kinase-like 1 n=1 Tax=Zeugodacus cucurbitae TaxID=28588 RepID=A0A0A1WT02_ZEUCU